MIFPARPSALLPAACLAVSLPLLAQQAVHTKPARAQRPQTGTAAGASLSLPIRRVALYKNGVGFFEHIGAVHGDQTVTIDFTTAQLNDVLQSLTAVDLGGGRIAGAGYNSTTPLDQQLKSLPLTLSPDPTSADFYSAIRGTRVEVTGAGTHITGRILNIELRDTAAPKKDETETAPIAQRHFLTVVSDTGTVRTLELTSTTSVRLLDPALHADVNRYLQILSSNHQDGLRHLTLTDIGTAANRELRVSYISEVPIWKCTYRLLFDSGATGANIHAASTTASSATASNTLQSTSKTATLQGWAVIDNTVGSDWNNVELSLIAGSPQSFLQPISQPYYSRRPEIGLPQEAQLTPQTHESGNEDQVIPKKVVAALDSLTAPGASAGIGSGSGNGAAGGIMGSMGLNTAPVVVTRPRAEFGTNGGPVTRSGTQQFNWNGTAMAGNGPMASSSETVAVSNDAIPYEDSASASITPNTRTSSFDDYFEYKLTDPVTIRKNESALVPILQTKVDVDPVTLWAPNQPQPLRALWIKNTSPLTLDRGSFSILENGNFSGQGLLDPIHPGERRLLSYAADQAVRVTNDYTGSRNGQTRRVQQITIAKGILTEKAAEIAEVEYLVHNAAPDTRTVIVEQPRRPGWTLDSDPKPEETTATLYRFRVLTKPSESVRLHIGERHTLSTTYQLANINEDQLTLLLRQDGNPPSVIAALQPIFSSKRRLADLDMQTAQRNAEIATITTDQNRLRQNLATLKGSAEERTLTKRYTGELNAQEDRLNTLKSEIANLQQQQQIARDNLATQLESLQLDATLS